MATGKTNAVGGKGFKYGEKLTLSDRTLESVKLHGGDHRSFNFGELLNGFLNHHQYGSLLWDSTNRKYYHLSLVSKDNSMYAVEKNVFSEGLKLLNTRTYNGGRCYTAYGRAVDFENLNFYTPKAFLDPLNDNFFNLGQEERDPAWVSHNKEYIFIYFQYGKALKIYRKKGYSLIRSINTSNYQLSGMTMAVDFDANLNIIAVQVGGRIRYLDLNNNNIVREIDSGYVGNLSGYVGFLPHLNCQVFHGRKDDTRHYVWFYDIKNEKFIKVMHFASTFITIVATMNTVMAIDQKGNFETFSHINGVTNSYRLSRGSGKYGRYTRDKNSDDPFSPVPHSDFERDGRFVSVSLGGSITLCNEISWYENNN